MPRNWYGSTELSSGQLGNTAASVVSNDLGTDSLNGRIAAGSDPYPVPGPLAVAVPDEDELT